MVKHTQTIRRQFAEFHFVKLVLKRFREQEAKSEK